MRLISAFGISLKLNRSADQHQQLKAHWQAWARFVGTDVGSPEIINRQKRIASGSLPVAGSNRRILRLTQTEITMMTILLTRHQLSGLLRDAAEMGATLTLTKCGQIRRYLNKSEAYRIYGRKSIESWMAQGLVTKRKDGDHSATWRIDRLEAEAVRKSIEAMKITEFFT